MITSVHIKQDESGNDYVECPCCGECFWAIDDDFEDREFDGEYECNMCGTMLNITGDP